MFARLSRRPAFGFLPLALLVALLAGAGSARAHGIGTSQLRLTVDGRSVEGVWEIQLRDARIALGLNPDFLGEPALRDLRTHEAELRALLASDLSMTSNGMACPIAVTPAPMQWDPAHGLVTFHLAARCESEPRQLGLHCDLLFDLDPTHRAYFMVDDDRVTSVGVFRASLRSVTVDVHQFHALPTFLEFVREGIGHIWTGVDHMLFLLALLLPAPLVRVRNDWAPRAGLRSTFGEVTKVVTAFTLSHSVTLALSFFGGVSLRAQWVEVAIAVSVFAAAWNNLRVFLPMRPWAMALGFGLVHGLGFAGALNNLSLPRHSRALALGAFNVGVEAGQLVVVAAVLPLLYAGSRRAWYPRFVMGVGSLLIAWLAVLWVMERAFGLTLFAHR